MDVAIWALILLMAFTGFFMVIGGFAALLYIIWQRGRDDKGRESQAGETNRDNAERAKSALRDISDTAGPGGFGRDGDGVAGGGGQP